MYIWKSSLVGALVLFEGVCIAVRGVSESVSVMCTCGEDGLDAWGKEEAPTSTGATATLRQLVERQAQATKTRKGRRRQTRGEGRGGGRESDVGQN